jgi:hypothetical protein
MEAMSLSEIDQTIDMLYKSSIFNPNRELDADEDYINNFFKDTENNNDMDKYEKILKQKQYTTRIQFGNNAPELKFYDKLLYLIEQRRKQITKTLSPPRITRSHRPSRRHRSVSPTQHTLGDGRVRSSGGKRTRKHKRSIRKRKHKKAQA